MKHINTTLALTLFILASLTCSISIYGQADSTMKIGTNFWFLAPCWSGENPWKWEEAAQDCGTADYRDYVPDNPYTNNINPWNPKFLEETSMYSNFRFMDWGKTNSSPVSKWSERMKPDDKRNFGQNTIGGTSGNPKTAGLAYEWMIDLCNRQNANMWVCIPHRATDNYIKQLAELIHQKLDPELKVYVEYSNEVWNFGVQQSYCDSMADVIGLPEGFEGAMKYQAYRSAEIWNMFENEFGSADTNVINVISGQSTNAWQGDHRHLGPLFDDSFNPTNTYPEAYGIAPYFGGNGLDGADPDVWEKLYEDAFVERPEGSINPGSDSRLDDVREQYAVVHHKYNLDLVAYEGGQHITQNAVEPNRDPRMYDLYRAYLDSISPYLSVFSHYVHAGSFSDGGCWGAKEYTGQPETQAHKYRALKHWILIQDSNITYSLQVEEGSGDGEYPEGAPVYIQANPSPSGKKFVHWVGDTTYLESVTNSSTTINMPGKDIKVRAIYGNVDKTQKFPVPDGQEMLWIGNSLIGSKCGGLPGYVNSCLEEAGDPTFDYTFVPNWGESLEDHWKNDYKPSCDLRARKQIKKGNWDYVVLQDYNPNDGAENIDSMAIYIRKFNNLIKAYNPDATIVLMMREGTLPENSPQWYEKQHDYLVDNYTRIGEEIDAVVVPLNIAWYNITEEKEDILYADDNLHPSEKGKSVNTYGFYSVFTLKSPVGKSFSNDCHSPASKEEERYLQTETWQVVQDYILNVSDSIFSLSNEQTTNTVTVHSKMEGWSVTTDADWINAEISQDTLVNINVKENYGVKRKDTLAVSLGEIRQYITIEQAEGETYDLNVESGSGSGTYYENDTVSIVADQAPEKKRFDAWAGDINHVTDTTADSTTVIMPGKDIAVKATFENIPKYTLTVENGSGGGDYYKNDTISIEADPAPEGKEFDVWTGDTSHIKDTAAVSTILIMPDSNITVTATYVELTGIANTRLKNNEEIKVYPNPGTAEIEIESPVAFNAVSIMDVQSNMVLRKSTNKKKHIRLNISQLAEGFYYIRIHTKDDQKFEKSFIKK